MYHTEPNRMLGGHIITMSLNAASPHSTENPRLARCPRQIPTEETEAMSDEWLPTLGVFLCLLNWKLISEAVSDSVCSENNKHL